VLPALFPTQLKQYLALSDDQVARMSNVSQQIFTLEAPKILRQAQLQLEISQETAKPVPDPTALGTRYAELESIRRGLDAAQKSLVNQTQAILGADQKVKLAALQQAITLYPIACSAVSANLLSPQSSVVLIDPYTWYAPSAVTPGGCGTIGAAVFGIPTPFSSRQP